MNWRVSGLDGLTLVSNSDAHSPMNLGREANLFDTDLSYAAMISALKTGDPDQFLGTFEFYPEEGKYHLDGHRNCNVRLWPAKTMAHQGKCPRCGKALTLGVLYRVEELADRPEGLTPQNHHPYYNLIPLTDLLSEILRVGPKTKKVTTAYKTAIEKLGCEFKILHHLDPDEIDRAGITLLGEAVRRMRQKKIEVTPGFDGEYGRVKIFTADEREKMIGQKVLFNIPLSQSTGRDHHQKEKVSPPKSKKAKSGASQPLPRPPRARQQTINHSLDPMEISNQVNAEQRQAVEFPCGALMIVAGPGTGKTRTLTHRIAWYIRQKNIEPGCILAVTFTNKAADEMRQRLRVLLGDTSPLPFVATFHGFCLKVLNDRSPNRKITIIDDDDRKKLVSEALQRYQKKDPHITVKFQTALRRVIEAKQQILDPNEYLLQTGDQTDAQRLQTAEIYRTYQRLLSIQNLHDYEDLIFKVVRLLESDKVARRDCRKTYQHIFADEYQDLNHGQYRIIHALAPPGSADSDICIIGDPDQSIYGFRGSDSEYFNRFNRDYPEAEVIHLTRNYRSTKTILNASYQVISAPSDQGGQTRTFSQINGVPTISIIELNNEKAEAEGVGRIIENLVGGTGFHSIDTGRIRNANQAASCSYSDFAVLYRTRAQHRVIAEVFENSGIPFQIASRETHFKTPGLSDLLSYFKVVNGDAAFSDFETVMRLAAAGIGKKTLETFKDWCYHNRFSFHLGLSKAKRFPIKGLCTSRQQKLNAFSDHVTTLQAATAALTVAEQLDFIVRSSSLESLLDNDPRSTDALKALLKWAEQFGRQSNDFITSLALYTDTDVWADRVEKVSLMTMHAAKGLEFPIVFICGCEQGYLPLLPQHAEAQEQDVAEERRLFYVAMTRAMERLYLTHAKKRRIYGQLESRSPSPFLADIETRLKLDESPRLTKKKKKTDQKQISLF
jgi:superfamily I DNA/RNA helicase